MTKLSFLVALLIAPALLLAADARLLGELDDCLKALPSFEYGKDSRQADRLEGLLMAAATDPQTRSAAEEKLLAVLAGDATVDAKALICRHLRTMGTARSIPQLEAMLSDPKLSHPARYALGRMEYPEAAQALLRALNKTSGPIQAGIINSLADLRYARAVPELSNLLRSNDPMIAEASASALGRLGELQSVKALESARPAASPALQARIDDALLACADQLLGAGQQSEAARIYKSLSDHAPRRLKLGAFRGLVAASGDQGVDLLVKTIQGNDLDLQRAAIAIVPLAKAPNATATFSSLLPSLQAPAQELLILALADRGDTGAAPFLAAAVSSPDAAVREAALQALGTLGSANHVKLLADAAANGRGQAQQIAQASLARLPGDDVNAAILAAIPTADSRIKAELIRALAARSASACVPDLLKLARDDEPVVRHAAMTALGALMKESDLPGLMDLAVALKSSDDLPVLEKAITAAFRRIPDPERQAAPILAALAKATEPAKPTLIHLLARAGTTKSLEAVRTAFASANAALKEAALRALIDWPNADAAEDLLQVASTSPDTKSRILSLRGYVRIAGLSKDPAAMYLRAMNLAQRDEDKRLVLAGLGSSDSPRALELAEQYLGNDALKSEAALAVVQVADKLRQADPNKPMSPRVVAAVRTVVATAADPALKRKAREVLNDLEQYDGYILAWAVSGPYQERGREAAALFDLAFAPEKADGAAGWKPLNRGVGRWEIMLDQPFGALDNACAYVRTHVISPAEQDAQIELGSDDGIKVFVNGKVVTGYNGDRGVQPRQNVARIHLQQGDNLVLLKVINHGGGWGFCCRIRSADGSAMEGLKFEGR